MRHRKKNNHLSRQSAHRKAMLANMASSLILHKRITTTTAKAKELRTFVEPLISRSREDTTHSRRMVFRHLRDKYAVSELFREVAEKVRERPGGYTRIIKTGNRMGDNADMCIMELVDYNENMLAEKMAAKPKTSRRRRGGRKRTAAGVAAAPGDAKDAATAEPEAGTEEMKEEPEAETPEAKEEPEAETPEAKEEPEAETPEAKEEPEAVTPEAKEEPEAETPEAGEEPGVKDESPETPAGEAETAPETPAGESSEDTRGGETDENNKKEE